MKCLRVFTLFVLCLLLSGLSFAAPKPETSTASGVSSTSDYFPHKLSIKHSEIFDVTYHNSYKIVTISQPWPGAESGLTYLLVQRGTEVPAGVHADKIVEVPIRSIVTLSTSYLPHLEMLDLLDTLIGHDAFAWVSSKAVLKRIESGAMKEVGSGPTVNVELLLDMEPDLIMTYGQGSEWDTYPKLEEVRLPFVINAEWNESTPLARAEWIKFMALFFNKEAEASELFDGIEAEYTSLLDKAAFVADKPTVFLDAPYQGTWWVAGGQSYAARFLADAGASYVWADDESTGSLLLDIETVFEKANEADYWLNTGYWNSLVDAKAADDRFSQFSAYRTGTIYNNNLQMAPGGGNAYYETGPAKPHLVLKDMIKIFHPELLPDHELYFYQKLD